MCVFVDLFICDCIPDTRHNYLVIFVEILLLILQQVLHCLLAIATDEEEKGEYFFLSICGSYIKNKQEITHSSSLEQLK